MLKFFVVVVVLCWLLLLSFVLYPLSTAAIPYFEESLKRTSIQYSVPKMFQRVSFISRWRYKFYWIYKFQFNALLYIKMPGLTLLSWIFMPILYFRCLIECAPTEIRVELALGWAFRLYFLFLWILHIRDKDAPFQIQETL